MKKFAIIAACAALAACGSNEAEEPNEPVDTAETTLDSTATGDMTGGMDWDALAKGAPVLVFYMAMKHLAGITARLMQGGRPADEPVAVVSNAATPNQKVLETTLAAAVRDAATAGMAPPCVVVVGPAVRLRGGLDWLGALTDGRVLISDPLGSDRSRHTG